MSSNTLWKRDCVIRYEHRFDVYIRSIIIECIFNIIIRLSVKFEICVYRRDKGNSTDDKL